LSALYVNEMLTMKYEVWCRCFSSGLNYVYSGLKESNASHNRAVVRWAEAKTWVAALLDVWL